MQNKDCRLGVKYRPNINCGRDGFKGKINLSNTCKRSLTCLWCAFTNPFLWSLEGHRWPENIIAVFNLFSVLETSRFNLKNEVFNGNRTEWSPIRSVIIWVINKIGRPRSRSPICLIMSMITDQIGWHEVLLLINHNFNKICDIIGYFWNQNTRNSTFCFASSEKKKPFKCAHDGAYCPIT